MINTTVISIDSKKNISWFNPGPPGLSLLQKRGHTKDLFLGCPLLFLTPKNPRNSAVFFLEDLQWRLQDFTYCISCIASVLYCYSNNPEFVTKATNFFKTILTRLQAPKKSIGSLWMKKIQRSQFYMEHPIWGGWGPHLYGTTTFCWWVDGLDGLPEKVDIKSYSATWIGLTSMALWSPGLHLLEDGMGGLGR